MEREYKRSRRYMKNNDQTDKIFMRTIRRSMFSMILCTVCLISSTWAWFVASAESQVSVIRLGEATLSVTYEGKTGEKEMRQSVDGEFKLGAGEYVVSVEPLNGTAPMYCVIDVEPDKTSEDLAERAYKEFYEEMKEDGEEWHAVLATDSNALLVLEGDSEANEYCEYLTERDEIPYELYGYDISREGRYRVDWAPGADRTFAFELKEKSKVTFELFWLTEDEAEDEYPELDEMNGCDYILIYQASDATPGDADVPTTGTDEAGIGDGQAESGAATGDGTLAANGGASVADGTQENSGTTENGTPSVNGGVSAADGAQENNGTTGNGTPPESSGAATTESSGESSGAAGTEGTTGDAGAGGESTPATDASGSGADEIPESGDQTGTPASSENSSESVSQPSQTDQENGSSDGGTKGTELFELVSDPTVPTEDMEDADTDQS